MHPRANQSPQLTPLLPRNVVPKDQWYPVVFFLSFLFRRPNLIIITGLVSSVQFNSHLFLSPIGARTLKMPVNYPPPSVGAYTRAPSQQPLVFGRKGTDHLLQVR